MAGFLCRMSCLCSTTLPFAVLPACPMPRWPRGWSGCSPVTTLPRRSCTALQPRPIAGSAMRRWRRLVQLDERLWLMELFHGPTLAFKDLALQLVGRLFDAALARRQRACDGHRRDLGRYRLGGDRRLPRPRCDRHFHPLPARPRLRGAAPADDDGRGAKRACDRDRGHLRRLPGSGQSAVRRHRAAREAQSRGGQFDQLGADRGADGLLLRRRRGARRRRRGRCRSACRPAISAMSMPGTSRAAWGCRSSGW